MTKSAAAWLKAFEALNVEDRSEVLAALVRKYPSEFGALTDKALAEIAATSFRMYDEEEENQERGKRNS